MSNCNSNRNDSGKALLGMFECITAFGVRIGGIFFALASAYLLWGIFSGTISNMSGLSKDEALRIAQNVQYACTALTIAGLTVTISAAIRFYDEEVLGYLMLIGGALFYWGAPIVAGVSKNGSKMAAAQDSPILHVVGQFQLIGMIALGLAVPFILCDFWLKLRGERSSRATTEKNDPTRKENTFHIFCWQTPYCREHLRGHCKAFDQHKSCWHIKSGCYCDQEMINKATKGQPGAADGFAPSVVRPQVLSAAQKRDRCRQCFLYSEHQKMKYKVLSPLTFPITIAVVWVFQKQMMTFFTKTLQFIDFLVSRFTFMPSAPQGATGALARTSDSSGTVAWVFMFCLALIAATLLLKALEYLIYEKQL